MIKREICMTLNLTLYVAKLTSARKDFIYLKQDCEYSSLITDGRKELLVMQPCFCFLLYFGVVCVCVCVFAWPGFFK